MKGTTQAVFATLFRRRPELEACREAVMAAFGAMLETYREGGKVVVCGNGGSAADAEHIVGELLNKFKKKRPLPAGLAARLPPSLATRLEGSLAAVSLVSMTGVMSAAANDIGWDAAFAQQLVGLGRAGDAFIAISTSGNSANCVAAAHVAKALDMRTIAFTGEKESTLSKICDVALRVPETETFRVQELHLSVYHAICAALEEELFG